jgi:hypothetical protein
MVGFLPVSKAGWLSGVNNLRVCHLPLLRIQAHSLLQAFPLGQSGEYSTACMFTEEETQKLYERTCVSLQSKGKVCAFEPTMHGSSIS